MRGGEREREKAESSNIFVTMSSKSQRVQRESQRGNAREKRLVRSPNTVMDRENEPFVKAIRPVPRKFVCFPFLASLPFHFPPPLRNAISSKPPRD